MCIKGNAGGISISSVSVSALEIYHETKHVVAASDAQKTWLHSPFSHTKGS
jgi:hypothetical protein